MSKNVLIVQGVIFFICHCRNKCETRSKGKCGQGVRLSTTDSEVAGSNPDMRRYFFM